jgi:hypothetical protein
MLSAVHVVDTMVPLSNTPTLERTQTVTRSVLKPLQILGFWSAVALPFLHIPLLLSGLETAPDTFAFLALFSVNVLALLLGHPHGER